MKKLDVPYFPKKLDKDCLAACFKMVTDYHRIDIDYDDMCDSLAFYSVGLSLPQMGKYALSRNLHAEIEFLNPYFFNVKDIGKSKDEIYAKIKNMELKNPQFNMVRDYFIDFMDMGGIVNAAMLKKQYIVEQIDLGYPIIITLCTRVIHGHDVGYNFHANTIYGYDDENFYMHDPEPLLDRGGGSHIINQDLVIYANTVIGLDDPDNTGILKVFPHGRT